ncbi:uncharacterized protein LOC130139229 [Syzygium oleosum]|uniref:uncharacterized protein LOC130139229 n=1 Tax=Syzygium oleosum TaxID=219896 RepID=UPI0024BBD4E5|nr:uncharacterized protein LOC130139229 [Syzygium oleosum]
MQKKSSSSFPSQVSEGQIEDLTPVRHNLAPGTCPAPVGPQAPPANAGSTAEGHNGVTLALPVQSQVANFGNALEYSVDHTFHPAGHQPISTDGSEVLFSPGDKRNANVELPILPHDIYPQCALPSQMIGSSSQLVDGNVPFSEPPHATIPSFQSSSAFPPLEGDRVMAGIQPTASDDDDWWADIFTTDDTPPDADTFFQTPPDDAV